MLELEGYTVGKCVRASGTSAVYTAVRDSDGAQVVLRCYAGGPESGAALRAEQEYELLRRIDAPGIIRALGLEWSGVHPVIVLERASGTSLAAYLAINGPLDARHFVRIALSATKAIEGVHDARILHRDINPSNLLLDPSTLEVTLIDFDVATPFGSAEHGATGTSAGRLGGALLYMAPEQTGRMDRGADFRSDLYALGATCYHMLTGRPPFTTRDSLALIHAHVARQPTPPIERREEVPATLSRIVMKLLQKEPDQRYQRAAALRADLEACLQQLEATGAIADDMVLGSADAPYRPRFSRKLYGRERELRELHAAYDRISAGAAELVLVKGAAGVGKSALVTSLRTRLVENDGVFAQGKFDLYRRERPYSGFAGAFGSLVDQWLLESDESLGVRAEELRATLGNLAGVLVDVIPELHVVLGDVAPAPRVGSQDAQTLLAVAVQRFALACASRQHPLVLLLDDLQWSDAGSRFLLESLLCEGNAEALLILGTYRDDEVNQDHPLHALLSRLAENHAPVRHVELGPLGSEAVAAMLADALLRTPEDTEWLEQRVERKTGNNPLLIQHFVDLMYDRNVLCFRTHTGWQWDEAGVEAAAIPDSAAGLLTAKIERLEPGPRATLSFASCMSDVFHLEQLVELDAGSPEVLERDLYQLSENGLIVPCRGGFRFSHDRIREVARAQLTESERKQLHYRMGLHLLARSPDDLLAERSFEIADHLSYADALLSEEERLRAIEIDLVAGKRGLDAGAARTAERYFAQGRKLFRESDWQTHPQIGFDLYHGSASAAYHNGEYEESLVLLDVLQGQPLSLLQWAMAMYVRIGTYALTRPASEVFAHTRVAVRRLGVRWPRKPRLLRVRFEIMWIDWRVRRFASREHIRRRPPERDLALFTILPAATACIHAIDRRIALLSITNSIARMLRSNFLMSSALVLYASYQYCFSCNANRLRRHAEIGFRRAMEHEGPREQIVVRFNTLALVNPWIQSRRASLKPMQELTEAALELGVTQFKELALCWIAFMALLSGEPLGRVRQAWQALRSPTRSVVGIDRMLAVLQDPREDPESRLMDPAAKRQDQLGRWHNRMGTAFVMGLCIFGRHAAAWRLAEQQTDVFERDPGNTQIADFCLFRGIAAAQLASGVRGRRARHCARTLRSDLARLRGWARSGPDFVHMASFLEAERAALRRQFSSALTLYEQTARRAGQQGYLHHAALAYEHRARLLEELRRSTDAARTLTEAIRRYRAWGAHSKVVELEATIAEWEA